MATRIIDSFIGLYDKIRGENDDFIDESTFSTIVDELVELQFINTSIFEDSTLYSAPSELKWDDIVHIDDPIKKSILLLLIENPKTFFVYQNTQKGKLKIASLEIKAWKKDKSVKVVAFLITDNDKTLTDQSVDGVIKTFGDQRVKIFALSSNSKTTFDEIKTYIDAYANDLTEERDEPEYPMPLIVLLSNVKQCEKMLKLLMRINEKYVKYRSLLRYGIIFDEADKTYSGLRDKVFNIAGENVSCRTFIVERNQALYRLGFVSATDGDLLDEDYPECANAYLYPVVIDPEDQMFYRALHHPESITHRTPFFLYKHTNNSYATQILEENSEHFKSPITLSSGEIYYRKIIINSNAKTADMAKFAVECNSRGMNAFVFNGYGGASVKVYRTGFPVISYKIKDKRLNEQLFYLYKKLNLNDKPLVIIGRRKVDRGLGFHYCPRTNDKSQIEGNLGILITQNRESLIWTDEILGRIEDRNTAVQKAGRLAGIIGNSPQYSGTSHYWTDEYTENLIRRHNTIVDTSNTITGCSILQAVKHAADRTPKAVISRDKRTKPISIIKLNTEDVRNCNKPRVWAIIERSNIDLFNLYKHYKLHVWNMETESKQKKWRFSRLKEDGAYSTVTNIAEDKRHMDILLVYRYKDELILHPWNGTAV
jgi:hypothetical protein